MKMSSLAEPTFVLFILHLLSCDVATVTPNRHKISKVDHPEVFIKSFMSITKRKTKSPLLKEI
jgi:hypothetical protein